MKNSFITLMLGLMLCLPMAHAQNTAHISHRTLNNGLSIYVLEDHKAPIAIFQIWYRVGGADESNGLTGISHMVEHMMFKGTKKNPGNGFSERITLAGGEQNAGTSSDYTVYYQTLSSNLIPLSFKLESDRMRNLTLTKTGFEKERKVVQEERRLRTENNPQALTIERLNATAFLSSPYQHPVVGWMQDLEQLTLSDLQAWYTKWYQPNNAFIVIAGDVNPKKMFNLAKQYFGNIPAGERISRKQFTEQKNVGLKRINSELPANVPWLSMGYLTPAFNTQSDNKNVFALMVLANVLDGGQSARFETKLVREQKLASNIGLYYSPLSRYDDLFMIYATPTKGTSLETLEKAIKDEIETLKETPPTREELNVVKTQTIAEDIFMRDALSAQAMRLGLLINLNLPINLLDTYIDAIKQIHPKQVQTVATEYLTDQALTVATLTPVVQAKKD